MGLQLVNILRDREEDLARGRSYLPAPDDRPWLDRAERWLKEGVFYAESLRNGRLRFSTVLPAWLGLDTLELLQRADRRHPSSGKVKIARGDVYFRMWKAFLFFLEGGSVAYAALFAADEAGAVCGEAGAGAGLFPGASSFFPLIRGCFRCAAAFRFWGGRRLGRQQVFPLVEFESFPHAAYFVEKFPASVRKFFIVGWAGLRLCGTGKNQVTYLQVGDGGGCKGARLGVDFTAQAQGPLPSFVARPGVSHQGRVQLVSHDDDGIVPELRGEGRGLVDDSQRNHDERIVFRDQEAVPLQFLNDPFRMVYFAAQSRFFPRRGLFPASSCRRPASAARG